LGARRMPRHPNGGHSQTSGRRRRESGSLCAQKIDQHDGLVTVAHTVKYLKGAATPAKPFPHSHQAASQFTNAVELS